MKYLPNHVHSNKASYCIYKDKNISILIEICGIFIYYRTAWVDPTSVC